jgi:Icc protein
MNTPFRLVQLSDCHVSADTATLYRGINPHRTLSQLLNAVRGFDPDLLLVSGDLSEDASADSYRLLKACLDNLSVPVMALPGNHDDPGLLAETFPGSPVDAISVTQHGPWQLVRLDSCLPGRPEGRVSDAALDELGKHLATRGLRPVIIALHHQPVVMGSPWIDKYPLLEPNRLLGLIDRHPGIRAVVWGHVHQVFETQRNRTRMLACPSTAINGRAGAPRFTPDTLGPAFRWLELYPDGSIQTGIESIEG